MHACMNLLNCLELHKPAKEGLTNQVTHIHTITIELTLNAGSGQETYITNRGPALHRTTRDPHLQTNHYGSRSGSKSNKNSNNASWQQKRKPNQNQPDM